MKIALCLAGGGIKGAAHIGALKAFEEENIDFEYIRNFLWQYCGYFIFGRLSSR